MNASDLKNFKKTSKIKVKSGSKKPDFLFLYLQRKKWELFRQNKKAKKNPKDKRKKYDSEKDHNRKKARNKEKRRNKEETEGDDGEQSKKIGRRKV